MLKNFQPALATLSKADGQRDSRNGPLVQKVAEANARLTAASLTKRSPIIKALVDGVFSDAMKAGEFERLYNKWFMSPIPPRGINLGLPMSQQLRDNLKSLSDKPAM